MNYLTAEQVLESLVGNHRFLDGNKRTAITSTGIFLLINGYRLKADNLQLVDFAMQCALGQETLRQISVWLASHSEPVT